MKTQITVSRLDSIRPILATNFELKIECDMTEDQMYEALRRFIENVTDETWVNWQERINQEVYGDTLSATQHATKSKSWPTT